MLPTDKDAESHVSFSIKETGIYTMFNLLAWSHEVAAGMEFIEQNKVVHADLAARNVLLSISFHAKICDFGLARQMVNYQYIRSKSKSVPVPWKWMSIESLRHKKFSTESDVWSYGIVLYEIFSLGNEPYAGQSFNTEFLQKLKAGLRLEQPRIANKCIYDAMLSCWKKEPEERPTFNGLKTYFHTCLQCYPNPSPSFV